jgi:hypothetical protein
MVIYLYLTKHPDGCPLLPSGCPSYHLIQKNETLRQQGAAVRIHTFHHLVTATFRAQQQDDDD